VKVFHADPWSRQGSHYSRKMEAKIIRFCKEMSMTAISNELGEPDNNLWRVFHHHVKFNILEKFNFKDVTRVCVDETATKRGHSYITIFSDYDTGLVLYVAKGRKMEVFDEFYGWLWDNGGHPGNVELFSMDMSVSYQAGRKAYFAGAQVVFDRFHIKQCLNDAVNKVRTEEVKSEKTLKKTKYIWLKNEQNLTAKQKDMLREFLHESSLDTARAYQLKSSFDMLWSIQTRAVGPYIEKWIEKALGLDLEPINDFVETIRDHFDGIVQSIVTGVTNAVSEGLNSLMQLARARARGYRNIENFMAMVYFLGSD
jgi:transposase